MNHPPWLTKNRRKTQWMAHQLLWQAFTTSCTTVVQLIWSWRFKSYLPEVMVWQSLDPAVVSTVEPEIGTVRTGSKDKLPPVAGSSGIFRENVEPLLSLWFILGIFLRPIPKVFASFKQTYSHNAVISSMQWTRLILRCTNCTGAKLIATYIPVVLVSSKLVQSTACLSRCYSTVQYLKRNCIQSNCVRVRLRWPQHFIHKNIDIIIPNPISPIVIVQKNVIVFCDCNRDCNSETASLSIALDQLSPCQRPKPHQIKANLVVREGWHRKLQKD